MTVTVWRDSRDIETLHVGKEVDGGHYRRLFTIPEHCFLELLNDAWTHSEVTRLRLNEVMQCEIEFTLPVPY